MRFLFSCLEYNTITFDRNENIFDYTPPLNSSHDGLRYCPHTVGHQRRRIHTRAHRDHKTPTTHAGRCRLSHSWAQRGGLTLRGNCEITKQLPGQTSHSLIHTLHKSLYNSHTQDQKTCHTRHDDHMILYYLVCIWFIAYKWCWNI